MLRCRKLTYKEIAHIYQEYMLQDFPANELKPLSSIERMCQQGRYQGVAIEEEGELVAYGMLLQDSENKSCLLDYFAVTAAIRGKGYGSKSLASILDIIEEDEVLVIEAENPKKAGNQRERELQERRLEFYRKNGVRFSELASMVYGAAYVIMYLSKDNRVLSEQEIQKIYTDFYKKWILGPEKFEKHLIMEKY